MHADTPAAGPLESVDGVTLESSSHIDCSNPNVDLQSAAEIEEHGHAFTADIHHDVHELRLGQGIRCSERVGQGIDGGNAARTSLWCSQKIFEQ
ncbi:hypothetical protein D9T14_13100 [Propionibacterium australiense]|nr:hypothetical protein D9T14_13100 [Propionibacterium australiense]